MAHSIPASILIASLWAPILVGGTPAAKSETASTRAQQAKTMKIRMDVNGTRVTATLEDNETSRDFISRLPLTLTLEDDNGTEKISHLAKKTDPKGRRSAADVFRPASHASASAPKCRDANARPEPDFKYFSKRRAVSSVGNSIETTTVQGR